MKKTMRKIIKLNFINIIEIRIISAQIETPSKWNYDKKQILFKINIKMNFNEEQNSHRFLVPSSIPRILQSNRTSCALQPDSSILSVRFYDISPKKKSESNEYTFEPKINSSNKHRRSIEKFVEDQEKYQQEKQRRLTEMREQITKWQDEQMRSIPQINSITKSKLSSGTQKCESVFERLSKEKPLKEVLMESPCFSPNILQKSKQISRQKTASDLLYDDAKRRHNKQRYVSETQQKRICTLSSPKINPNTNDLVRKKILSEFMNLISDQVMNPILALSVLQQIFNVKLRDISSPSVKKIIELIVNDKGEVLTQKLWSFIAVVIGSGEGCFPEEDQKQIKQNYKYFYKERMNKEKKKSIPNIPKFQPQISQNSNQLAEKYRQKLCKRASEYVSSEKSQVNIDNQTIALQDLFIIQHMQRRKENEKRKLEKENLEIQECTFKPTISLNQPNQKPKQKIVLKHTQRQKKSKQEELENTERDISSSKRMKSTEKDQTQRICLSNSKKADIYRRNRRSVENLSIRMSMGRIQRELMNNMTARGYEKNKNWMQEKIKKHRLIVENAKLMKGLREY